MIKRVSGTNRSALNGRVPNGIPPYIAHHCKTTALLDQLMRQFPGLWKGLRDPTMRWAIAAILAALALVVPAVVSEYVSGTSIAVTPALKAR